MRSARRCQYHNGVIWAEARESARLFERLDVVGEDYESMKAEKEVWKYQGTISCQLLRSVVRTIWIQIV